MWQKSNLSNFCQKSHGGVVIMNGQWFDPKCPPQGQLKQLQPKNQLFEQCLRWPWLGSNRAWVKSWSILIRIWPKKWKVKRCTLFQQNRSFHIIDRIHYSLPKTNSNEFISRYITTIGHMTHTLLLVSIKKMLKDLEPFKEKRKTIIWFWIILLVFTVVRIVWRKFEWFELRCTTLITIELK